jgi:hypothetical protein
MKRFCAIAAAMVGALLVGSGSASAGPAHKSCAAFGQSVAADARAGNVGDFARTFAPLNDEVAFEHGFLCEPA